MINSKIYVSDLMLAANSYDFAFLENKTILITGSTGLIGSAIVDLLSVISRKFNIKITVIAVSRSIPHIVARNFIESNLFKVIPLKLDLTKNYDLYHNFNSLLKNVSYVLLINGFGNPYCINNYPADICKSNVLFTCNLLDYFVNYNKSAVVLFFSSGEIYGNKVNCSDFEPFFEDDYVNFKLDNFRNLYPFIKIATEFILKGYYHQYASKTIILRLCHVFGPTYISSDDRFCTYCINQAAKNLSIKLIGDGKLVRSHCYVIDAAAASLFILNSGEFGESYNVSDNELIMSLHEFAKICLSDSDGILSFSDSPIISQRNFAVLSSKKLSDIGFKPIDTKQSKIVRCVDAVREAICCVK